MGGTSSLNHAKQLCKTCLDYSTMEVKFVYMHKKKGERDIMSMNKNRLVLQNLTTFSEIGGYDVLCNLKAKLLTLLIIVILVLIFIFFCSFQIYICFGEHF